MPPVTRGWTGTGRSPKTVVSPSAVLPVMAPHCPRPSPRAGRNAPWGTPVMIRRCAAQVPAVHGERSPWGTETADGRSGATPAAAAGFRPRSGDRRYGASRSARP